MPADKVNPAVVEAMLEEGIDISSNTPKILTDEDVQGERLRDTQWVAVTLARFFPEKFTLDWALTDPAGQGVDAIRPIRDEIRGLVENLIAEIDQKTSH